MPAPLRKGKSPHPQPLSEGEGSTQPKSLRELVPPSGDRGLENFFVNLLPGGKVYYSGNREVNPGLQIIDMETIPYNAKFLYVTGFRYLALKPEAAEILKDCSESQLHKLIELKKEAYPADVPILEKALELKKQ